MAPLEPMAADINVRAVTSHGETLATHSPLMRIQVNDTWV